MKDPKEPPITGQLGLAVQALVDMASHPTIQTAGTEVTIHHVGEQISDLDAREARNQAARIAQVSHRFRPHRATP